MISRMGKTPEDKDVGPLEEHPFLALYSHALDGYLCTTGGAPVGSHGI